MVQLENIGYIITITFILTGLLMTAVAQQDEAFSGLAPNQKLVQAGLGEIEDIATSLSIDLNKVEGRSDEYSQSTIGIDSLFLSFLPFADFLLTTLTSWTNVLSVAFGFTTDPAILLFKDALQTMIAIIMLFTAFRFIGTLIKSLPFL